MKRENVKQIIKELATQNFNSYPESYPAENGLPTAQASSAAQDLAKSYYENRTENEIKRDEITGINEIDYIEWVMAAFNEWVRERLPELIVNEVRDGKTFQLPSLTQQRLIDLGWDLEEGIRYTNFRLIMREDVCLIATQDDGSDPQMVADSLEKMGGLEGIAELIEFGHPIVEEV